MFQSIRQLFGLTAMERKPAIPPGQRVYAVGDVHGRIDLFEAIIEAIEEDDAAGVPARTTVVLSTANPPPYSADPDVGTLPSNV